MVEEIAKQIKKELKEFSRVYGALTSTLAKNIGTNNPTIIEIANIDDELEIIERNKNKANRIRFKGGE